VAVLLGATYAYAGGGAPGRKDRKRLIRPAVRRSDRCEGQSVWKMASPNGDTLSQDKAVPFVVNYQMVDTDKDGKISADEFKTGCSKGWIQEADASTVKDMKDN
jgi:hypothetical protein